jgi:hypothetical protein
MAYIYTLNITLYMYLSLYYNNIYYTPVNTNMNRNMTTNQKRIHLNLQQKAEVVKFYKEENGQPSSAIKKFAHFNLKHGAAKNLYKSKSQWDEILSLGGSKHATKTSRIKKTTNFPVLEKIILKYTSALREGGTPLTFKGIQSIALLAGTNLYNVGHDELKAKEKEDLRTFTASNGFVSNFIVRNGLDSFLLHGKDGSCPNSEEVQAEMSAIRLALEDFEACHIFNVDETGLFFRCLPRRSYIHRHENKRNIRGTAQMNAKDRITAICCTNAVGDKVPIVCIGKAKNPRIFRTCVAGLPCVYFSQAKAWSTSKIFRSWYTQVFLPYIRTNYPGIKVVLLMDNCGSHGQNLFEDPFNQVKVLCLPKNTTSRYQPMDAGIIATFKTNYRYGLLYEIMKWISVDIGENAIFPCLVRRPMPKQGYRGIQDGKPPNILEALTLMVAAWDKVTPRTVVRCWLKTTVLPAKHADPLLALHGKHAAATSLPNALAEEIVNVVQNASAVNVHASEKNMLLDMQNIFKDADSTAKAFNDYVAVDDDPDIALVLENEILDAVDVRNISSMDLEVADTSEKKLPPEKISASNYHEMMKLFDSMINLGKNDSALTCKLRSLKQSVQGEHKPKQVQQRLSVMWQQQSPLSASLQSSLLPPSTTTTITTTTTIINSAAADDDDDEGLVLDQRSVSIFEPRRGGRKRRRPNTDGDEGYVFS